MNILLIVFGAVSAVSLIITIKLWFYIHKDISLDWLKLRFFHLHTDFQTLERMLHEHIKMTNIKEGTIVSFHYIGEKNWRMVDTEPEHEL